MVGTVLHMEGEIPVTGNAIVLNSLRAFYECTSMCIIVSNTLLCNHHIGSNKINSVDYIDLE